jgi:hypothetical protein
VLHWFSVGSYMFDARAMYLYIYIYIYIYCLEREIKSFEHPRGLCYAENPVL